MGFWDRLFGTDNGDNTAENARKTKETPAEETPAEEGHHEVFEEALDDADVRQVDDPRVSPEESSDSEGLFETIRRTPPVPMPGFSNHADEEEPAGDDAAPAASSASSAASAHREPVAAEPVEPEERVQPVLATPPEREGTAEDQRLLDSTVSILQEAGITPNREVTVEDVADCQPAGLNAFRARPLTTVIQLVDSDGQPLLSPVYRDLSESTRTTPEELKIYVQELAEAVGTAESLSVTIVPDPGSTRRGSIAVNTGPAVRDVPYDLDPDFGDEAAEAALSYAVAPETVITHPVVTDVQGERLTVWASKRSQKGFFAALDAENPQSCDGPPPKF